MSLPSYLPKELKDPQPNIENINVELKNQTDYQQREQLLNYYRYKIDKFESERIEWMAEIEQVNQTIENHHWQEIQILKAKQEIAELQKVLSDSHLSINDEKNTVNSLRLKYEDLLKIDRSDQRKIGELKSLDQAISLKSKQAVNFKDCRPMSAQKSIPLCKKEQALKNLFENSKKDKIKSQQNSINKNKILNKNRVASPTQKVSDSKKDDINFNSGQSTCSGNISQGISGGIVKTVILPYDEINNIKNEIEYLKQYKMKQKNLFEETIQDFQKDKIIRMQEFQLKQQDMIDITAQLKERLLQREQDSYQISKDYFQYKHQVQRDKEIMNDQKELLLIEKRALEDQLQKVRINAQNDQSYAVDLYNQKTEGFADRFRKQAQQNENDLKVVKVQYDQLHQKYVLEVKLLQSKLQNCKERINVIESRRVTENQAFTNDIQSVKKRVINFERYIKRLKKHVDEENTSELINELENTNVAQIDMNQLISDINKIQYEVKQAKKLKIN